MISSEIGELETAWRRMEGDLNVPARAATFDSGEGSFALIISSVTSLIFRFETACRRREVD